MFIAGCFFGLYYQAKKDAKLALAQQGFKVPSSDQLSVKRVDPAKLEVSPLCFYCSCVLLPYSHTIVASWLSRSPNAASFPKGENF